MWRAVIYFIFIAILGIAAAWVADQPGDVTLTWLGREITMDIVVAIGLIIAVVVGLILFWALVRLILNGPQAFSDFLSLRRERSGYSALSSGMLAVGSGNAKLAAKHAKHANKILSNEPLTLLLQAQTAQLNGNDVEARRIFDEMAQREDTELFGLHGLFVEAQRAGDMELARAYAERAVERQPELPWAGTAVLKLQSAAKDWDKVEQTIDRNQRNKLMSKAQANQKRAVLLSARALGFEENDENAALRCAEDAHKLAPELVPAAVIAGRIHASRSDIRKATRILERTWRHSPHPDIAEIYAYMRAGDSPRDRLKRVKSLAQIGSANEEGAVAVARAAIDAQAWEEARAVLAPYTENRPGARICTLMAEIEQSDAGDTGRVREWLARAVHAPRDPVWTADGFTSLSWLPTSPVTGELGAFQWKVPVELIGAEKEVDFIFDEPAGDVVDVEIMPEVEPEEIHDDAKSDDVIDVEVLEEETATPEPANDDAAIEESSSEEASDTPDDTEAATETETLDETAPSDEPYVAPRPPDDPGPRKKPDEDDSGFFNSVSKRLGGS